VTRGALLPEVAAHRGLFGRVCALLARRAWSIVAFGVLVTILETSDSLVTYGGKDLKSVRFSCL